MSDDAPEETPEETPEVEEAPEEAPDGPETVSYKNKETGQVWTVPAGGKSAQDFAGNKAYSKVRS